MVRLITVLTSHHGWNSCGKYWPLASLNICYSWCECSYVSLSGSSPCMKHRKRYKTKISAFWLLYFMHTRHKKTMHLFVVVLLLFKKFYDSLWTFSLFNEIHDFQTITITQHSSCGLLRPATNPFVTDTDICAGKNTASTCPRLRTPEFFYTRKFGANSV